MPVIFSFEKQVLSCTYHIFPFCNASGNDSCSTYQNFRLHIFRIDSRNVFFFKQIRWSFFCFKKQSKKQNQNKGEVLGEGHPLHTVGKQRDSCTRCLLYSLWGGVVTAVLQNLFISTLFLQGKHTRKIYT